MRVTEGMMTSNLLADYDKVSEKKAKTQTQLANNSKIDTLSDDLAGSLKSITLQMQINKTNTFIKNSDSSKSFINSSLYALDNVVNEVQKSITTTTASENPINVENYATMAQSLKDSMAAIVQSVNSKQNDMYLFGGTNYKGDPVSIVNGKGVPTTEDLSGQIKAQISQNVSIDINISGSKVFNTGIFPALNDIIDSLSAGQTPTEAQKTALKDAYSKLVDIQSLAGQSANRIDDVNGVLKNQLSNYQELQAKISEVDVAQLSMDLQTQDYLLQILNKVLATSLPKTVFDYI